MARRQRKSSGKGSDGKGRGPLRRCLVSGALRAKGEMLRFVVDAQGEVVPDLEGRLPGRGMWLSPERDMVTAAGARNLFAKAARTRAVAPEGLADLVERLLARRCLALIGMARRAGQARAGSEKVRAWLRAGRAGVLLAASDGAAASRARMRTLAPEAPVLELFDGDELGSVAGRGRTVHLALAPGRLADTLLREAARLSGFRSPPGVAGAPPAIKIGPGSRSGQLRIELISNGMQ